MSVKSEEDMMEKLQVKRQEAIGGPIGPQEQEEQAAEDDGDDIFGGLQWLSLVLLIRN